MSHYIAHQVTYGKGIHPQNAIRQFYDFDEVDHFRVNFNSPGKFEAIINSVSASSLISTLLAVANSPRGTNPADVAETVKEALVGPGKKPVVNEIDRLVASLRDDGWDELNRLADEAKDDMNIDLRPQGDGSTDDSR